MGTGVQEIKHAAKLQEWTAKVADKLPSLPCIIK